MLTFGRDGKARVWVVIDGNAIFVDRNADGDLTGPTKRKKAVAWLAGGEPIFEFGNLRRVEGKKAQLTVVPRKDGDSVKLTVGGTHYRLVMPGPKGLRFAARPQDAPVIPVEGPLRMILAAPSTMVADGREHTLTAHIGTSLPGGGYVAVCSDWPPEDVHPIAKLTFVGKKRGGPPLEVTVRLEHRC
jgi:hypothetical protein